MSNFDPANPLLNSAQAEAVYRAMCELNNVCGKIKVEFGNMADAGTNVFETDRGVHVVSIKRYGVKATEFFPHQSDFAAAYGQEGAA